MLFSMLLPALALLQVATALPAPEKVKMGYEVDPKSLEASFKKIRQNHKAARIATTSGGISTMEVPPVVVTTRNELIQGGCKPIIVIFGRGTTEPGNVGDDVGPSFFYELEKLEPGRVLVQGVNNYKADIWGYLGGGSNDGAADMAASVARAVKQCPTSKIVLSGFSQGAQVTHKAAKLIPAAQYPYIGAIVLFGDPNEGDAFPGTLNNHVITFCADGDLICDGWPIPTDNHSNYEDNGDEAAQFVANLL